MAVSADTLGPLPSGSPAVRTGRWSVRSRRRAEYIVASLTLGLVIIVLWAVGTGAVPIAPAKALAILFEPIGLRLPALFSASERVVLLDLRLPRVVPHLLRLLLGADHRHLLPGTALLGAALLVGADLAARTLIAPAELPIGILTSLVGGPFLLWLLVRERRMRGWL